MSRLQIGDSDGGLVSCQPSYAIGRRGVEVLLEWIGSAKSKVRVERLKTYLQISESSLRKKSN